MLKFRLLFCAATLAFTAGVQAQTEPNNLATANMHFDPKAIDTNGDNMITKDEFMAYGDKMWNVMAKGADSISVKDASADFARGNMNFNAKAMNTSHTGMITKDEFMAYGGAKFDKMKNANGMIPVDDAWKDFGRGNMHPSASKTPSSPTTTPKP